MDRAKITVEEVRNIARLARISLDKDEEGSMVSELGTILDYVEKLNEISTEGVEPLHHPLERSNVYREDEYGNPLKREDALANAPRTDGVFFIVSRVI
ncbi:Asp-tRNA(Asn)/Glu-tRNA(Gln) amidotransferase subunit GatC [Thermodesulforhabdus norvegica]|uniref:Aspartyl/glutamyl-tRNA(Asn/Gln) amidotransferase subunit C n=1 Tax=Thermodesulforhabdus norvegica TaxID=39841 RepID=A0A1I4VRQ7_9BACT|nr:Asp-tRNA(Asn)/Glu-tRNA(Gln) amidotransferase subunit GatC [Thermodesulforhabdus norvegica]SFN03719.1 aspartyl/glutamyl-tRNA(Asn/Gln) amidotransferase subunit C [Thermodesulforhabdus norvegica]